MAQSGPTQFPELNTVLADLVARVKTILGENFVGAYLQGSFALGDGDAFSDVDWVVVTREDPEDDMAALNAMHAAIHDRPEEWAQHLEGSYAPLAVLRSLKDAPKEVPGMERPEGWNEPNVKGKRGASAYPLLYLNNGARSLVRSEHDNTEVVRWVLREHGVALAGPAPHTLIDPVDPGALRAEVLTVMRSFGGALLEGSVLLDALWLQGFTPVFFARTLNSLETATIPSKPAAIRWASTALDRRWLPLLERAWEQRSRYPRGHGAPAAHAALPPDAEEVAETLAFVRYAFERAGLPGTE